MQLVYGLVSGTPLTGVTITGYGFDPNAVELSVAHRLNYNRGGQPVTRTDTFTVNGYLSTSVVGTPAQQQADLTAKELALEQALLTAPVNGASLIFLNDDNSVSAEVLSGPTSLTGVRCTHLSFNKSQGPEYATIRSFVAEFQCTLPLPRTANLLLSFEETLTFWGGYPVYVHRPSINSTPQKQMVYPASVYSCTQVGTAVGFRAYPAPPPPKFPYALKEAPKITKKSPERMGNPSQANSGQQGYSLSWEYHFEDASPLVGALPSVWTN